VVRHCTNVCRHAALFVQTIDDFELVVVDTPERHLVPRRNTKRPEEPELSGGASIEVSQTDPSIEIAHAPIEIVYAPIEIAHAPVEIAHAPIEIAHAPVVFAANAAKTTAANTKTKTKTSGTTTATGFVAVGDEFLRGVRHADSDRLSEHYPHGGGDSNGTDRGHEMGK